MCKWCHFLVHFITISCPINPEECIRQVGVFWCKINILIPIQESVEPHLSNISGNMFFLSPISKLLYFLLHMTTVLIAVFGHL